MDSVYFWAPTICVELDIEICEEIAKEYVQQNVNKMYRLREYGYSQSTVRTEQAKESWHKSYINLYYSHEKLFLKQRLQLWQLCDKLKFI